MDGKIGGVEGGGGSSDQQLYFINPQRIEHLGMGGGRTEAGGWPLALVDTNAFAGEGYPSNQTVSLTYIDFPKKVPVSVPYLKGSHVFALKWWSHAVWHDWPWRRSVWFSRFTPEKPLGIINDSPHPPPSSVGEEGRSDSSGSCRLVGTTSTATDWSS